MDVLCIEQQRTLFYLRMLDPCHNHAVRLKMRCFGSFSLESSTWLGRKMSHYCITEDTNVFLICLIISLKLVYNCNPECAALFAVSLKWYQAINVLDEIGLDSM